MFLEAIEELLFLIKLYINYTLIRTRIQAIFVHLVLFNLVLPLTCLLAVFESFQVFFYL